MPPGSKRANMQAVASEAGVSRATVSFVLNGRPGGGDRISDDTRSRVIEAASRLGYVPNQAARSLRRQRTDRVCLYVPRLGIPVAETMARSLQEVGDRHGYSVVILTGASRERWLKVMAQLQAGLADGAMIYLPIHVQSEDLESLAEAGLSLMVTSQDLLPGSFDVWRTTSDVGLAEAVDYLVRQGKRHIALQSRFDDPLFPYHFRNWQNALAGHGILDSQPMVYEDRWTREGGYLGTQRVLQGDNRPDAIIGTSDIGAIGALHAVRDAGLRVPEDVAVIGMGNISEGEITKPQLTTIGPVVRESGRAAESLFARILSGEPMPGQTIVEEWHLIHRGSA